MKNIVSVKNLIFDYKSNDSRPTMRAIDGVSLDVQAGDFIAIIGHNGSGKSTFAKQLNAMLLPTSGTVFIDEIDTKDNELTLTVRQTAGLVFQNPDDQIVTTVAEEDVAFGPENLAVPTEEIVERVDESLRSVGMKQFAKKSPLRLSGGQKQRVAIAGVLAMQPKCLVLDEPTSMLDPVGREEVIKTLHTLNKEKGMTIIMVTHNMEEVVGADKIFVMNEGQIIMQGTPKEVFSKVDELKAIRLEVPTATELAYELKKSGVNIPDGILSVDEFVEEVKKLER